MSSSPRSYKKQISDDFSRAAPFYAEHAQVQKLAEGWLYQMAIPVLRRTQEYPFFWMDVGCGTGSLLAQIIQDREGSRYSPIPRVLQMDIAYGMCREAKKLGTQHQGFAVATVNADMEILPIADGSVSLLYSNMAMQWASDRAAMLEGWQRLLCSSGSLFFTTLGEKTLAGLRSVFQTLGKPTVIVPFASIEKLEQECCAAGLEVVASRRLFIECLYPDIRNILYSMKVIGARYKPEDGQRNKQLKGLRSPWGRNEWEKLEALYRDYQEAHGFRPNSGIWEIWAIEAIKKSKKEK